jgi:hypothetical protein
VVSPQGLSIAKRLATTHALFVSIAVSDKPVSGYYQRGVPPSLDWGQLAREIPARPHETVLAAEIKLFLLDTLFYIADIALSRTGQR